MSLPANFGELLANAREKQLLFDYQLRCRGTVIRVHRLVVGMQSPVLCTALSGSFKEKEDGFYEIKDFEAEKVIKAVDYFYTGDYQAPENKPDNPLHTLLFHAEMSIFADKYMIQALQSLAEVKFEKFANSQSTKHLLYAIPLMYKLEGESLGRLQSTVAHIVRYRMGTCPLRNVKSALAIVASESPQFFYSFFEQVWDEGTGIPRKCSCGPSVVTVTGWRCHTCKDIGVK